MDCGVQLTLPGHCAQCGVLLQGGATRHLKTCWWYPLSYIGIMEQERPTVHVGNDIRENRGKDEKPKS
jgi:hypothetical protein